MLKKKKKKKKIREPLPQVHVQVSVVSVRRCHGIFEASTDHDNASNGVCTKRSDNE